jgi:hypothetical protein
VRPGSASPPRRGRGARAGPDPGAGPDAGGAPDQEGEGGADAAAGAAAAAAADAAARGGMGRPLALYQALDDAEAATALLQARLLDAVRAGGAAQRQADEAEAAAAAAARRAERREAAAREAGAVRVAQLEDALQRLSARGDAVRHARWALGRASLMHPARHVPTPARSPLTT